MRQKLFFTLKIYLFITLVSILSCENCNNNHPNKFKIKNALFGFSSSPDKTPISYQNVSFTIEFNSEYYFAKINNSYKNSFINISLACDTPLPETDEKIENIEIFSNIDYNSENLKDKNISNLFNIVVKENNLTKTYDLDEYLLTNPKTPLKFTLILKEAPEKTNDFEFTIKYYQKGIDINFLKFTTNSIPIKGK